MYHLIDFVAGKPLKQVSIMGEPPDVAVFKNKIDARTWAESRGYEMIIEDRFLLNNRKRERYEPIYIKIVEVNTTLRGF